MLIFGHGTAAMPLHLIRAVCALRLPRQRASCVDSVFARRLNPARKNGGFMSLRYAPAGGLLFLVSALLTAQARPRSRGRR
jgi:hypothetical protein